jgi:phage FluMu gp28-like protein
MAAVKAQFRPGAKVVPAKREALFLPYQERWIKDNSKIKAMEKSRQIGISWATAYRRVRQKSLDTERYDDWVSSRDDIQARLFLEDCKRFAGILNKAAKDLGERVYNDEKGQPFTAYTLEFANGLRIHSMSSNPDAQAGKRGSRVFDEFALHKDPRKLYAIGKPGITWGGQMEIISTHRGSHNFFNREIVEDAKGKNKKRISLHTVTLQTALEQGFLWKLQSKLAEPFLSADGSLREGDVDADTLELLYCDEGEYFDMQRAEAPDEESFQQEYMCVPSDDASAFLSYDLIDGCCYNHGEDWEQALPAIGNPLYVGVDIGRDHDLTVIWVVEMVSGTAFTRKVIELQAMPFSAQEKILYPILELPGVKRTCIDQTGIGRQFAERAAERFGTYRVEGVTFTQASKEEMAYPVRAAFEDRSVRIPRDEKITADLRSIKKETTASGNVRFSADRGKNGHADRFWGLALALYAGKTVSAPFRGSSIPVTRPRTIDSFNPRRRRTQLVE